MTSICREKIDMMRGSSLVGSSVDQQPTVPRGCEVKKDCKSLQILKMTMRDDLRGT